jgi:hypothetical protein
MNERTRGPRFSRQQGTAAETCHPSAAAARRSRYNGHPSRPWNAVAPKRRPGTAGGIDGALTAIDRGFGRHGARCTARLASSLEEKKRRLPEDPRGFTTTTTCSPPTRVGTANRLLSGGIGFVNPFAVVVRYTGLGCPLRSVESGTQLHLILRPYLESPRQARSIELLGTTRVGS